MPELGLFPLPIVLLPTERIPLHIFEPRYRELIEECIETGTDFGLVLTDGEGAVHEIGTRASVAQVLERLDDGRLNIIVEGGDRFRLLELTSGRSFTTGIVEDVEDEDEPAPATDVERVVEVFTALASEAESDVDIPDPDSPLLDFELAARVDFAPDAKQELLASTSPGGRMSRLIELLEIALQAVKIEKALRERAGKNGKVTPLDLPGDSSGGV
jgi:ATP-dependent Lon protease